MLCAMRGWPKFPNLWLFKPLFHAGVFSCIIYLYQNRDIEKIIDFVLDFSEKKEKIIIKALHFFNVQQLPFLKVIYIKKKSI